MKRRNLKTKNDGFTIVELMVATVIFSVILLIIATGLLQIGRTYYKGITSSRVQEVARTVMDDISRTAQFAGGNIIGTTGTTPLDSFCIGQKRFSFLLGRQMNDNPTGTQRTNVLVRDTYSASPPCTPQAIDVAVPALTPTSDELLSPNMRLAKLQVVNNPAGSDLYEINIRVVYGDDDLLCSPTDGNCSQAATVPASSLDNSDLSCKNIRVGTQFCAVSELRTIIKKRVR